MLPQGFPTAITHIAVYKLGAIAFIRIALGYFLGKDLEEYSPKKEGSAGSEEGKGEG